MMVFTHTRMDNNNIIVIFLGGGGGSFPHTPTPVDETLSIGIVTMV